MWGAIITLFFMWWFLVIRIIIKLEEIENRIKQIERREELD